MTPFRNLLSDQIGELEQYIDFLTNIEELLANGVLRLGEGASAKTVTPTQQHILYSSFYLQVYNTIEATVVKCLEGLEEAINKANIEAKTLKAKLQKEWVKSITKLTKPLNEEKRLEHCMKLFEELVDKESISSFCIKKDGGGNWDDKKIECIIEQLGWNLNIEPSLKFEIKRNYKQDHRILGYIKFLRNKLAHGNSSFAETGKDVSVSDLKEIKDTVEKYLESVVDFFEDVISNKKYQDTSAA